MFENILTVGNPTKFVWTILGSIIPYYCLTWIYNIYFHPLSRFPGPKRAAMGFLWEFYWDVLKDGTYLFEIERMHRKYGPIVRINPRELHIYDPYFYSSIYAGGGRRIDKDLDAVAAFAVPQASLATVGHDLHRLRREILSKYFSKRSIVNMEPVMNERIDRLIARLEEEMHRGVVVDFDSAFACLTADVITQYFYGSNFDHLGSTNFKFEVKEAILGLIDFYHWTRFFPSFTRFMKMLPIPIIRIIQPGTATMLSSFNMLREEILSAQQDKQAGHTNSVILEALNDESIPPQERHIDRLQDEASTIVFAGTETTARSLSVMLFHLLHDKSKLTKLRTELNTLSPAKNNIHPWTTLEQLPYLTGVVNEGIRLAHGPLIRLPRVATEEPLQYNDFVIPPGTPVSQSTYFVHMNPEVFPNPSEFDPERWVKAAEEGVQLNKFIASFTKGSRQCLGINMAYAELYLTISRVVHVFDMDVRGTVPEDLFIRHIRLTGYPEKGLGEVKAIITGKAA